MEVKSIFDLLRNSRSKTQNSGKNPNKKSAHYSEILMEEEPKDDLVGLIKQEFAVVGEELTEDDLNITKWYLRHDYAHSYNAALGYFGLARKKDTPPKDRQKYLTRATNLINRAHTDLIVFDELFPNSKGLFKSENACRAALQNLQDLRDKIKLVLEFPETYDIMMKLHFQLKSAVSIDNFEYAVRLRDRKRAYGHAYDELLKLIEIPIPHQAPQSFFAFNPVSKTL